MSEYKLKKPVDKRNKLLLRLYIAYNFVYAFYMLGLFTRMMYLSLLFVYLGTMVLVYLKKKDYIIFDKNDKFRSEYKNAMIIAASIAIVSIFLQLYYRDYCTIFLSHMLYLIIPATLAFFWINTTEEDERYTYFVIQFIKNVVYFVFANHANLTLSNILAIKWSDSKSSVFETPYAHDFFFLEVIFLYCGKTVPAVACMILCMLNFKRISFILSGIYFIGWIIVKHRKRIYDFIVEKRQINPILLLTMGIVLCIIPIVEKILVSDEGLAFFYQQFGISLNDFSTGRVGLIRDAMYSMPYFNGFGSTTEFMRTHALKTMRELGSIHCDWLSLYMETGIIGVVVYTACMLRIGNKNVIVFCLMCYLFLALITTHFFDDLGVWILFYMFASFVYSKKSREVN